MKTTKNQKYEKRIELLVAEILTSENIVVKYNNTVINVEKRKYTTEIGDKWDALYFSNELYHFVYSPKQIAKATLEGNELTITDDQKQQKTFSIYWLKPFSILDLAMHGGNSL